MATPLSSDRRRISPGWYTYRLLARDASTVLPAGWKRIWDDEEDLEELEWVKPDFLSEQQYYFWSNKEPANRYWYPFPILESNDDDRNTLSLQTAYLFTRTERAYLSGHTITLTRIRNGRDSYIWLMRPNGQHVGYIMLHDKEEMEVPGFSGSLRSMELVATCKGYTADISVVGEEWDAVQGEDDEKRDYWSDSPFFRTHRACYFVL